MAYADLKVRLEIRDDNSFRLSVHDEKENYCLDQKEYQIPLWVNTAKKVDNWMTKRFRTYIKEVEYGESHR